MPTAQLRYWKVKQFSRSIVLIGMMGAGKSSVGRCLHRKIGLVLLDTDEMVASNFGMSIAEIFAEHGEKTFREAEPEALRSVPTEEQTIIITGGGIVLRKENVEILRSQAAMVWLTATGKHFLRGASGNRITIARTKNPRKAFSRILGARKPLYANIGEFPGRYLGFHG